MNARALSLALLVILASACGEQRPPLPPPSPAPVASAAPTPLSPVVPVPAVVAAPLDVDPVAIGLGRTQAGPGAADDVAKARDGIVRLCAESLARANASLDEVRAMDKKADAELTWDTTVGGLDRARIAIRNAGDFLP